VSFETVLEMKTMPNFATASHRNSKNFLYRIKNESHQNFEITCNFGTRVLDAHVYFRKLGSETRKRSS
jgi:hypothetical protein